MLFPAASVEAFFEKLTSIAQLIREGKTGSARSDVMDLVSAMSLSEIIMWQEMMIDYCPEEPSSDLMQQMYCSLFGEDTAAHCLRQMFLEELNAQAIFPLQKAMVS